MKMVKGSDVRRAGRVCAAVRRAEWKRQVNTDRAVNTPRLESFGNLWHPLQRGEEGAGREGREEG